MTLFTGCLLEHIQSIRHRRCCWRSYAGVKAALSPEAFDLKLLIALLLDQVRHDLFPANDAQRVFLIVLPHLAPSPRLAAYLARCGLPTMALTTTNYSVHDFPLHNTPGYPPTPIDLPAMSLTPVGDPWPRPYYLENGLRRVAPYHYTYNTYCKQRWRGRTILDIFSSEFRDRDYAYYKNAIETGQITINGKPCVDTETKVKNGDVVSHTMHRHEPPVTAQPIRTINEDDELIVIDKPAGVPVHPAGRYKFNSVVEIMRAERHAGFNPLPVNRLDRLTSGVMFIGKHPKSAETLSLKLRGRMVRKEYVARVKGKFPDGDGVDGKPGVVTCEESILQISPILGLNRARASGKSAKTLFKRVAYYPAEAARSGSAHTGKSAQPAAPFPATELEGYSIVHCLPLTGRTHQIRVHLQFLGHPITNDPIYSNRRVFGPSLARNDASEEHDKEIIERLGKMGKTELAGSVDYGHSESGSTLVDQTRQMTMSDAQYLSNGSIQRKPLPQTLHAGPLPPSSERDPSDPTHTQDYAEADPMYGEFVKAHDEMVADYNRRKGEKMTGEKCQICDTPLYSDPGPQELGIYLHALAYSDLDGKWSYRSPPPAWAVPPKGTDGPTEIGEWEYRGDEVLEIGDEKEEERRKNRGGMKKNKDEDE